MENTENPGPDRPSPGEFDLIRSIRARASGNAAVRVGIGDDCAVLEPAAGSRMLVTKDMLIEGRHFLRGAASDREIGYKALAVNLSDIAAMAGTPVAAFVAVALPRHDAATIAGELLAGMLPLAERFGVALAGGDTNAWDGPLVLSVTLIGAAHPRGPVLRSGARPGDAILVTGPLGGSLLGRHLAPRPRIAEAIRLADALEIRAMIDLSDGLSSDLGHILEESGGVGAILDLGPIPIHADARILSARDQRPAIEHALDDGEDFELCLTLAPGDVPEAIRLLPGLVEIGRITAEPGLFGRQDDGTVAPLARRGFDHLRPSPGECLP